MYHLRNGYSRLDEILQDSYQTSFFRDDRENYILAGGVKRIQPSVLRLLVIDPEQVFSRKRNRNQK